MSRDPLTAESAKAAERVVVIVEDSESTADTLAVALLRIPGLSVELAHTGREALGLLERRGAAVCALVTDLNMPRMDGFELIRRVRQDPRHARLPIIVLTADTDPRTPERVWVLGVDAFFAKPYSPAQVRQRLEELLDANRSRTSE